VEEYARIVSCALKNIPLEFIDDARQAGYVGILAGLSKLHTVKSNKDGFLYRCARNEILKELGRLHRPFSLSKDIFILYLKYKNMKDMGTEDLLNLSESRVEQLEKLVGVGLEKIYE